MRSTAALRITLVWEPPRLEPTPLQTGPERFTPFLSDLKRHNGKMISLVEGLLCDVMPAEGFVLLAASIHPTCALAECPPERQAELATRLVPIDVSRTGIFEMLEKLSLPAAIDGLSLAEWACADPHPAGARGVYGQRVVGQRAGADCLELFASARYCYLQSESHDGLPHLLVDYLRAWTAVPTD